MSSSCHPSRSETARLAALQRYEILDTPHEAEFDDFSRLAAEICQTPIALISLVDRDRQWFKSEIGLGVCETPLDASICRHAILQEDLFIVPDARLDPRFKDNPLVAGDPHVRFYAGAPLATSEGLPLGALCVLDYEPRQLTEAQGRALSVLARQVMTTLELRLSRKRLQSTIESISDAFFTLDHEFRFTYLNGRAEQVLRRSRQELLGGVIWDECEPGANAPFLTRLRHAENRPAAFEVSYEREGLWLDVRAYPSPDGWTVHLQDVTARRKRDERRMQAEAALRASQASMAAAQRIAHFGSWELDLTNQGDINANPLRWSDEMFRIAGYEPGTVEVSNELFFRLVPPSDHEPIRQAVAEAIRERGWYSIVHRLVRADGEERLVHETAQIFFDEKTGQPLKMVGTAHDITEQRKIARQLETERARLVAAQAVAKLGSWETDLGTYAMTWSEETHRIFEIDPAGFDPTHEGFLQLVHPDDRAAMRDAFLESLAQPSPSALEHRVLLPDGGMKIVAERWQVFFDEQGKPVRALGTCKDITERRQAEETLRENEQRFRQLAENIKEVFWLTDPAKNEMLYVSPAYEEIWGRSCDSLYRSPGDWRDAIHPEDRERVRQAALRQDRDPYDEIYRIVRSDGKIRWIHDRAYPVRNKSGDVYRIVGTAEDITERREAEEKLREQATLLDKAQDAILLLDLAHQILYWNQSAERLYGWAEAEVSGRSIKDLLFYDPADFLAATTTTLTRGEWAGEIEQVDRWGKALVVEGRWTLMRDGQGNAKSILAINTDITGRRKLEQQFLRAQRMESIGTLAGGIAHDLNNVLAPIMMSVELLRSGGPEPRTQELLEMIRSSARRGADMVSQVLSFARGVEGRRVEVLVDRLIADVVRIAEDTFPKNIRFETRLATDLWTLGADPTQLHQVLLNLCVNARDAMPDGGRVTMLAENVLIDEQFEAMNIEASVGPHVCIVVEDSGTGIPKDVVGKIFEPFFTTKEMGQGTGLGLSTVLAIARSHGGFIQVESDPGSGSRFSVYLPAKEGNPAKAGAEAMHDPALPKGQGETILVVDDEDPIRQVTKRTLEAFGYTVLVASDGAEAVSIFAASPGAIDVVLTDMMMPLMDGPTLIHILQKLNPEVRIIGASGVVTNDKVARSMQAGVKHFLRKPFSSEVMLRALHAILKDVRKQSSEVD